MTDQKEPSVEQRITEYLSGGGLFNPELSNHDAVRDLLIDCRAELTATKWALESANAHNPLEDELTAARLDAKSWSDQCAERVKDWDSMRERAELAESMTANTLRDAFNDREELAALRKRMDSASVELPDAKMATFDELHQSATALLAKRDTEIEDLKVAHEHLMDAYYHGMPSGATLRCRKCGDTADIDFHSATLPARKESNG